MRIQSDSRLRSWHSIIRYNQLIDEYMPSYKKQEDFIDYSILDRRRFYVKIYG